MAVTTTSRLGITRWSAGGDPFTRLQMDDSHAALENKAAIYLQGTAASRPSAGTVGRFYYATDTNALTYDDGIGWREVGGGTTVVMSPTEPTSPRNGTVWVDTDSDVATLDATNFIERSILTTRGDIIVRSSVGPNRLGAGTDGFVLTADSTNGLGVRWAKTNLEELDTFTLMGVY